MFGRANRRILTLLGFSGALHAGALLAYGYFYPAPPQAVVAAPIIQLQLQSGLVPELPHQNVSSAPDQDAVTAAVARSRVVVTNSLQARLSLQTRVVALAPLSPSNPVPVSEPSSALPVAMAPDRTPDAKPEQRTVRLKPQAKVGSMLEAPVATLSTQPEEVVTALLIEQSVTDITLVATDASGSEQLESLNSTPAASSRLGSAAQLSSSAQLATARSQLGEQLLQALESYFSYPLKARRKGWQGEVRLRVDIDRNGEVAAVLLASSSGYGVLDRAALKSMNQVAEIDLPRLQVAFTDQPFQVEIPVAYRLVN